MPRHAPLPGLATPRRPVGLVAVVAARVIAVAVVAARYPVADEAKPCHLELGSLRHRRRRRARFGTAVVLRITPGAGQQGQKEAERVRLAERGGTSV